MGEEVPEELRREVDEAAAPVLADAARAIRAVWHMLGGAEGIAALEAAIDARDAARAVWEAEHPGIRFGQQCHCFCRARGHGPGLCLGDAVTFEVRYLHGQPVQVFLCQPCADFNRVDRA
jgi:hypothetical protein